MLQRTVHTTGAKRLPTNGTVDRIDYVMLEASLQLIILHQRLTQFNRFSNISIKLTAKDSDPVELHILIVLFLMLIVGYIPFIGKQFIDCFIIHYIVYIFFLFIVSIIMNPSPYSSKDKYFQDKKKELPVYTRLQFDIHKIQTEQKIYYYCECQKKDKVLHDDIVLVICQQVNKPITTIYFLKKSKITISKSLKDQKHLGSMNGIQLSIINTFELYQQNKILLQYRIKEMSTWHIRFQSKAKRDQWFQLIHQKKYQLAAKVQQLYKQKISIKVKLKKKQQIKDKEDNPAEIAKNITFTINETINSFLNSQIHNIKEIIKGRLNDSSLDKPDQQLYMNDKLSLFVGNYQIFGKLINDFQEKITALKDQNKYQATIIQQQKTTISQIKSQKNQLQELKITLKKQINDLQSNQIKINEIKDQLQNQIKKLSQNKESLQQTIKSLNKQKQNLEEERIQKQKEKNQQDKERLETQRQKEENNKQKEVKYTEDLKKWQQKLQSLQNEIKALKIKINQLKLQCFFQGELLNHQSPHKQYIKQAIQSYRNRQIEQTKLIYTYDPNNKTNFHQYIDYHPNIVLIVKTLKGSLIAAYSKDAFSPTATSYNSCGIIMSLSKKMNFYVQQKKRSVSYDEYYIIFGNSQIRIRSQQDNIFSNFGIANSYYNSNGFKVDVLLDEDTNREVPMETFEVYQLTFKEE